MRVKLHCHTNYNILSSKFFIFFIEFVSWEDRHFSPRQSLHVLSVWRGRIERVCWSKQWRKSGNWNAGCCALTRVKWGEFTSRSSLRKDILTLRVLNLKNIILSKPEILWYHFRDIKKNAKYTEEVGKSLLRKLMKRRSEGNSNSWCHRGIQQFLIRGSKLLQNHWNCLMKLAFTAMTCHNTSFSI